MNKFLIILTISIWFVIGRPYIISDAQQQENSFIQEKLIKIDTTNKVLGVEILDKKNKIKQKKFDTAFYLQSVMIKKLREELKKNKHTKSTESDENKNEDLSVITLPISIDTQINSVYLISPYIKKDSIIKKKSIFNKIIDIFHKNKNKK